MLKDKVVLITQLRLSDFTGSEVVTLELVETLSAMMKKVYVVTTSYDDPVRSEFEKIKNVTVLNINDEKLTRMLDRETIDFAWIHHSLIPVQLLENPGATKFIFHHMSPFAEFESPLFPVIEKSLASTILCNSVETKKSFLERKLFTTKDKLEVFNNPAPKKFDTTNPASKKLKSLLVVSNHLPSDLRQALKIVSGEGVVVDVVGVGDDDYHLITPAEVRDHDAVVSIGKTVQYAILSNRPAYCYDKFGGPGYLTEQNFSKARDLNFSGRGFTKRDPDTIAKEILTGFTNASRYAGYLYEHERETFTLETRLQELLKNLTPASPSRKVTSDVIENYKVLSRMLFVSQPSIRRIEQLERENKIKSRKLNEALQLEVVSRTALNDVRGSFAYKTGRIVTIPVRIPKKMLRQGMNVARSQKYQIAIRKRIANSYGIRNTENSMKVALVIRSKVHPTSSTFIRLISPLTGKLLSRRVNIYLVDGSSPKIQKGTHAVIVQRTALATIHNAKQLVQSLVKSNSKLFVDTDDAFGELDTNHPQYLLQKERVEALDYVMNHANETWFSTEALRELHNLKNTKVIRNTLDDRIWRRLRTRSINTPSSNEPLRMVYMGTITHDDDFALIVPALNRLHDKYQHGFELHVIGVARHLDQYPWMIQHAPDSALYPDFVDWFNKLPQFDIGLSPLEDSSFNRNKSDIKCLDYLACGIHPVVSNVKAYENKELDSFITRVNNTEAEWYAALEDKIKKKTNSRKRLKETAEKSFDYILSERSTGVAAAEIAKSLGIVVGRKK